jgi:hypothetical protein
MLLEYFGEKIDEKLCDKTCDNCMKNKSNVEKINLTNIISKVPKLFELTENNPV